MRFQVVRLGAEVIQVGGMALGHNRKKGGSGGQRQWYLHCWDRNFRKLYGEVRLMARSALRTLEL